MKKLIFFLPLLIVYLGYGQTQKSTTDKERLDKYIAAHVSYFTFDGRSPGGKGWDILAELFAKNQFVAWGEYHNSPLLSQLTIYALETAGRNGYKKWCVEVGQYAASELMRISKSVSPVDTIAALFKAGYPGIGTLPFFSTNEDAQMLIAARKSGYTIWGIDQEFQMSFPYCLAKIYQAQPRKLRQRYKAVYDSLQAKWWYPNTQLLDSLDKAIRQKQYKSLLNGIRVSKEIYRNSDNAGRATLMKANFFSYYEAADKYEKVFLKMGSNHLAKGMNLQTNLYDIGNAVYELAQRNQTGFANVYIMVRFTQEKGRVTDDLVSNEHENPKVFSKLYVKDQWVLVDLKQLKLRYDNTLSVDTYQLIEKYDYVLVSPEVLHIGKN